MYYKFISDTHETSIVLSPDPNNNTLWIPMDDSNTDYQIFLQYLSDNNLTIDDIPLYVF